MKTAYKLDVRFLNQADFGRAFYQLTIESPAPLSF